MTSFDRTKRMEIEELDNVNGGYIFNPDEELIAPTWEVIDDKTGNVMWNCGSICKILYAKHRDTRLVCVE